MAHRRSNMPTRCLASAHLPTAIGMPICSLKCSKAKTLVFQVAVLQPRSRCLGEMLSVTKQTGTKRGALEGNGANNVNNSSSAATVLLSKREAQIQKEHVYPSLC
eukprot:362563-Chlamydomonas_euryale.AAC.5